MAQKLTPFARRRRRVRTALRAKGGLKPRLSIHRTSKHIYAQVIDDEQGVTVAAASSLEADEKAKGGSTVSAASEVGKRVAERAKQAGVARVVFDRGGFIFHGRVKALADAAREGGLEF
ncbi:50S ribosomal protein L18 [Pacificimonas sp. WHA3]|uniref:Large ribosomal subunit protein uL18 n=1 Tax=Pacificimonas pallii TaxID=2827236 RepID=A0ABS6SAN0_9SPHN|nr:50S ribosomal protein L18 [Pacificimonas pallii]MBV7255457.1 50S ribosomal protein L18 [Pacificimonas pallii]